MKTSFFCFLHVFSICLSDLFRRNVHFCGFFALFKKNEATCLPWKVALGYDTSSQITPQTCTISLSAPLEHVRRFPLSFYLSKPSFVSL